MKKTIIWLAVLIAYIVIIYFYTVLDRETGSNSTIKMDLFWGYDNPPEYIYRDNLLNIAIFIPIGVLAGIIIPKHRLLNALMVGLLVSLVVESSQLIWKRGTFDVDDLFNNTLGAVIGGGIIAMVIAIRKRVKLAKEF